MMDDIFIALMEFQRHRDVLERACGRGSCKIDAAVALRAIQNVHVALQCLWTLIGRASAGRAALPQLTL